MKIKSRASSSSSSSKIKISKNCKLITLLTCNISIVLVLVPIYRRLLQTATLSTMVDHQSPASMLYDKQKRLRRPLPPSDPYDIPLPSSDSAVPYIGEESFNKKYADAYKGLIPSSKRAMSDPSCGKRPDFFAFFTLPKTERSRFHEDKIIYDLFKNTTITSSPHDEALLPRGTYVELGAFDGKDESNTMFFDKCLMWDGLLIEGQSQSYQKVISNRPHAIKSSFSPTCKTENQTANFYDYPLSNNGIEGLAKSYDGKETIQVPCGPLTPVLQDVFGPSGKITFFSLDVEGAELLVLETIDFNILQIDVIMVEIQNSYCPDAKCQNVHNIRRHMAMTGKYVLFADFLEASDVYIRSSTTAWKRAKEIEWQRKVQLEREIREHVLASQ